MEDRRRFRRLKAEMKGRYFLEEKEGEWKQCIIININRECMGITFLTQEKNRSRLNHSLGDVHLHGIRIHPCQGSIKVERGKGK